MIAPTVSLNVNAYRVSFEAPNPGGALVVILAYDIQLLSADSEWLTPTSCASDATIVSQLFCEVDLTTIQTLLGLVQGEPVIARISAQNEIGFS